MKILFILLLILSFHSCSTKKGETQSQPAVPIESLDQAGIILGKITSDLDSIKQVTLKWSDAESRKRLNKLNQSQQNLTQYLIRTREDAEKKGAPSIDFKNLNKQFESYRNERNELKDYLETKNIFRIDPKVMNMDFIEALNTAKKTQLRVKNELMDFNVKFNQSTESEDVRLKKKAGIQELVKIVEQMENETFRLQRVHTATMQEFGPGAKFVTPGKSRAYLYQNKIKSINDLVQAHEKRFYEMAESLELRGM